MDFSQINQQFNGIVQQFNVFFAFIGNKLKNFKNLTLGEQIAYSVIIAGLLLIIISIILFML